MALRNTVQIGVAGLDDVVQLGGVKRGASLSILRCLPQCNPIEANAFYSWKDQRPLKAVQEGVLRILFFPLVSTGSEDYPSLVELAYDDSKLEVYLKSAGSDNEVSQSKCMKITTSGNEAFQGLINWSARLITDTYSVVPHTPCALCSIVFNTGTEFRALPIKALYSNGVLGKATLDIDESAEVADHFDGILDAWLEIFEKTRVVPSYRTLLEGISLTGISDYECLDDFYELSDTEFLMYWDSEAYRMLVAPVVRLDEKPERDLMPVQVIFERGRFLIFRDRVTEGVLLRQPLPFGPGLDWARVLQSIREGLRDLFGGNLQISWITIRIDEWDDSRDRFVPKILSLLKMNHPHRKHTLHDMTGLETAQVLGAWLNGGDVRL